MWKMWNIHAELFQILLFVCIPHFAIYADLDAKFALFTFIKYDKQWPSCLVLMTPWLHSSVRELGSQVDMGAMEPWESNNMATFFNFTMN